MSNAIRYRVMNTNVRYGVQALLDEESLSRLTDSAEKLEESLGAGKVIYG